MKINYAIHGLVSSLLLNLGFTRLAEKFDPMLQQSGAALMNLRDAKSSAFSDLPCQFKSSAFSDLPCQFKTAAFSDLPCQFAIQSAITLVRNAKSAAFSDLPCQFKTAAFSDLPCQFSAQSAS